MKKLYEYPREELDQIFSAAPFVANGIRSLHFAELLLARFDQRERRLQGIARASFPGFR